MQASVIRTSWATDQKHKKKMKLIDFFSRAKRRVSYPEEIDPQARLANDRADRSNMADLVRLLGERLGAGEGVGAHCRQGVGRSAVLAACLLMGAGVDAESAWRRVGEARGRTVPDTAEQREWAARFAREFLAPTAKN